MPCALLLRPLVRGISRWAMLLSVTLLACKPVLAEPLPKDECTRLQEEETLLEGGGAAANLERGPDWGKVNLTSEQLKYVARLIEVREMLAFRCRTIIVKAEPSRAPPLPMAPDAAPTPDRNPMPKTASAAKSDQGAPPPPSRADEVAASVSAATPAPERKPNVTAAAAGAQAVPETAAQTKPKRKKAAKAAKKTEGSASQ